jgi:hypothetical protein
MFNILKLLTVAHRDAIKKRQSDLQKSEQKKAYFITKDACLVGVDDLTWSAMGRTFDGPKYRKLISLNVDTLSTKDLANYFFNKSKEFTNLNERNVFLDKLSSSLDEIRNKNSDSAKRGLAIEGVLKKLTQSQNWLAALKSLPPAPMHSMPIPET